MKMPAVSILIPTYNYARYLPEAIESILNQDFSDFEVIIADDASSDNTVDVCATYAEKDSRIRFFRHEQNLGMVENWNWCLQQATGKYIKYMLADDKFLRPYALSRLVESIDKSSDISLVTSARVLIDDDSQITGVWNLLGLRSRVFSGKKAIRRCLTRGVNLIGEPSAVLFRREHAKRGFDPAYRQLVDLEMWLHLLQQGDFIYISEPLCCFRKHSQQQTEVNRRTDCHLIEPENLFGSYGSGDIANRVLFKRIHVLCKQGNPANDVLIAGMRSQISPSHFIGQQVRYWLTRPFINLGKSASQRLCAAMYLKNI
jgi:glycosyltransferase involved in cell wall biosynthesis